MYSASLKKNYNEICTLTSVRKKEKFCHQTLQWSLTAVKANCRAKGKSFICFWSACSAHISFFSTFGYVSSSKTAHLPPENNLNVSKFRVHTFFEPKIQGLLKTFKDTFPIFQGLHSVQKRALSLFFSSSTTWAILS